MGLFSTSSPFDACVERATSEKNTGDEWGHIMDVCDKVKDSPNGAKDCMKSISKRLANDNPRVVLQTITLLDACINNCGRKLLLEVAGREFEQDLYKLITNSRTHLKVSTRLRESLKKWAESEFNRDPELSLIPALYNRLLKEGYEFDVQTDSPKKTVKYSNDPDVVNNAQEEEDIAKAIQLSLQESGGNSTKSSFQGSGSKSTSFGLYSNASAVLASEASAVSTTPEKEPMKVRAVYDFEAAEDNELTFKAGEIIIILDNSDANWWKGTNHRGEGLFPANFVTTDLDEDTGFKANEPSSSGSGKRVLFNECVEVAELDDTHESSEEVTGEVDEEKIDQLLHLLHEADPTGDRSDDPSLPLLEEQVNAMAPIIDADLECIDKKHAQLARISTDLVDALNLYHQLMRDMPSPMPYYSPYGKLMTSGVSAGQQGMVPPHYLPSNPQNMPPQGMFPPNQYPSYVGAPGGRVPQFLPPHMVPPGGQGPPTHMGSPNHQPGTNPPTSSFQSLPPSSQSGGVNTMGNFHQFNPGAPEYGGMPGETAPNMVSAPSTAPINSQPAPGNIPQHGFPHQAHPMSMPPMQGNQGHIPPQGPLMNVQSQQGPNSAPPQGPPISSLGPQVPSTSMPASSMVHQGPPASMAFYSQPQMQQPLL